MRLCCCLHPESQASRTNRTLNSAEYAISALIFCGRSPHHASHVHLLPLRTRARFVTQAEPSHTLRLDSTVVRAAPNGPPVESGNPRIRTLDMTSGCAESVSTGSPSVILLDFVKEMGNATSHSDTTTGPPEMLICCAVSVSTGRPNVRIFVLTSVCAVS